MIRESAASNILVNASWSDPIAIGFKPVTALPYLLDRSRRSRDSKNAIANFLKDAKAASLQLRSPPAEEAKVMIIKEIPIVESICERST